MIAGSIRLLCMGALAWTLFLAVALLHISLLGYTTLSGDKPVPYISDIVSGLTWPLCLIPTFWLIFDLVSGFYPRTKKFVEHHLFIPSLIAVTFSIVFTFSVAAALPWIPIITRISGK